MKTVITARLQNNTTLKINDGQNVEIAALAIDIPQLFYVVSSQYEQPAIFSKESKLLIKRAKLEFYGAQGLRPGLIQGNTNWPAYAALVYKVPQAISASDQLIYFPYFNEWFDVGQEIQPYGDVMQIGLNAVRGWYDSIGISQSYNGNIFEVVVSLEIEAIV